MIEYQADSVYVLGDLHGDYRELPYILNKIGENAIIIQVGDYGIGFASPKRELAVQNRVNTLLQEKNIKMLVGRGNHDNPSFFQPEYISPWKNITFLPDYTSFKINGKKFLWVGGAVSIDRLQREEDYDYWIKERFVLREDYTSLDTDYDFLLCHSAPNFAPPLGFSKIQYYLSMDYTLKDDLIKERKDITELYNHIKPLRFYYGHFHDTHVSYIDGRLLRCLNINEFVQIG